IKVRPIKVSLIFSKMGKCHNCMNSRILVAKKTIIAIREDFKSGKNNEITKHQNISYKKSPDE
ncbi:MAG TPA: hypothetical protein P5028_07510, partial [Candidatus Marinimicrobia bacterium]|nr:hypothetical protein [Candidatus Neomarinimicrobiota bacterium]